VLEVADIVRQHGAAYRARHPLAPSQERALRDIEYCRTAFFGGHVAQCDHCAHRHYVYHSCRNRHCPKCHTAQTQAWLAQQQSRLLPCPHYLLTFTLPAQLRPLAWAHPKLVYSALLRCAAAAVQTLTRDPRWLGATPAILAVLHTWTRSMLYHPHVHLLVSAGGLTSDGQHWLNPKHPAFLVPVRALSVIFRAKFKAVLAQARLLPGISKTLWQQPWVVHALHAGRGDKALGYLARYVLRVALANSRLEAFHDGQVTFRYRDNRTQQLCRVTLAAEEFLRRFLLHILPAGFPKIRYYGLASVSAHPNYQHAQVLLQTTQSDSQAAPPTPLTAPNLPIVPRDPRCPKCHAGHLLIVETLRPRRKFPP
jgi:hypothetical protein